MFTLDQNLGLVFCFWLLTFGFWLLLFASSSKRLFAFLNLYAKILCLFIGPSSSLIINGSFHDKDTHSDHAQHMATLPKEEQDGKLKVPPVSF